MNSAKYNFKDHIKGDTFKQQVFTFSKNDAPINLTGASIKIQFKKNKSDSSAALTLEIGTGITLTDAVNGEFAIDEQIIDLTPGQYYYDIQLTQADSTVFTYVSGNINILQDVTA